VPAEDPIPPVVPEEDPMLPDEDPVPMLPLEAPGVLVCAPPDTPPVVPVEPVPMEPVEVEPLCPLAAGVVLVPFMFPVLVEPEVCPTPAGIDTVPEVPPVVPVEPAPAEPVAPPVWADAKAVKLSASVAVIKSLFMNLIS